MKLSPAKVEHLASLLVDELAEVDGVIFQGNDSQLRLAVQEIITHELMVEENLDAEIHKLLQEPQYKTQIVMERMSYDVLFKKIKQRFVQERKLVL